jgi:hypothetical protein
VAGLTIDDLVRRTGHAHSVLATVLRDEVACGRVVVEDGQFSLRPGALPDDVAQALRGLSPPDTAFVNGTYRRRPSGGRVHRSERRNLNWVLSIGAQTGRIVSR